MAQAIANPNIISLAAGLVDYASLPVPRTASILHDLLSDAKLGQVALQYGTTEGLAELRQMLLDHLLALDGVTADELNVTANDVVVTTGSQQMLFMLTDLLIDPGDIVITEWPSYFVYTGTLESAGAVVRCVDIDEDGLIPKKLDDLLAELAASGDLSRVKMVYTCDYHQNPSGITLSADRRPQILDIVKKYSHHPAAGGRIFLLEDSAYRELTFEGSPPPSIKKYDTTNEYVGLLQTFSKPFSPGLKTGYGLLPRGLTEPLLLQKGNHDFGSNNLAQHLLLAAMKQGIYAEHVEFLCTTYAAKRDAMLAAMDEHLAGMESVHWTRPTGGLYVYLTLPETVDTSRSGKLFQTAIDEGVLYVPGDYCYGPDSHRQSPCNTMRLSFGVPTPEQIQEGIARLAKAIRTEG